MSANYPLPAGFAARNWPLNRPSSIGTQVAIFLEEVGFPRLTTGDKARLDAALGEFLHGTTPSQEATR